MHYEHQNYELDSRTSRMHSLNVNECVVMFVAMKRSDMYGHRGAGRFSNQQGLLGNANVLMGNQMTGLGMGQSNMQVLNPGGDRDFRREAGLFPMGPSLGMREMQQLGRGGGGFAMNSNSVNMNMPAQPQDVVLDILVHCMMSYNLNHD